MSVGIPRKNTTEEVAASLREALEHPEYATLTVRQALQFLADFLEYGGGWVAMSIEELIVRNHYSYLGATKEPEPRTVEMWQHEALLMMLGRIPKAPKISRYPINQAVERLVNAEILTAWKSGGNFISTSLANPKLTCGEAAVEVHRKINEKRA